MKYILLSVTLIAILGLFKPANGYTQTSITTDSVIQLSTCAGGPVIVPFTVTDPTFNLGNTFYAELSNGFGLFNNPDTIGSIPFTIGTFGIIFATLPDDIGFGPFYRVRVVGSDPKLTGTPSPNTIIVTSFPSLADISADPSEPICEGLPVVLSAGSAFPGVTPEYTWSTGETTPSITVTQPGNYNVTATALGCDNEGDGFELTMLPAPAAPTMNVDPNGVLNATSSVQSFNWYLDGSEISIGSAGSLTPNATGWYHCVANGMNGCLSAPSPAIYYLHSTGSQSGNEIPGTLPDLDENLIVRVYPNPTTDLLHIETYLLDEEKLFFILYDAAGRVAKYSDKEVLQGYYHRIVDLSEFPAGMYNLQLFVHGMLRSYNIVKGN